MTDKARKDVKAIHKHLGKTKKRKTHYQEITLRKGDMIVVSPSDGVDISWQEDV